VLSSRARGGHCLAKYCYYFDNFVEVVGCMSVLFGGSEHQLTCNRAFFLRLRQLPTGVVDAIPNFREKVASLSRSAEIFPSVLWISNPLPVLMIDRTE